MSAVDSARRLISRHGKAITYSTVATSTYDPATGAVVETTTPAIVKAVITQATKRQTDALATEAAIQLLLAPGVVLPAVGDRVTIDSVSYLVKLVDTTYQNAAPALFTLAAVRN